MKNKRKYILLVLVVLITGVSIFLGTVCYKSYNKSVEISSNNDIPNGIAIYIEDAYQSNNYIKTNQWPNIGSYAYNSSLSSCDNGSLILYNELENVFNIKYHGSDSCNIYYNAVDKSNNLSQIVMDLATTTASNTDWKVKRETNNNYYYQGADPNNYICIGSLDTAECLETPSNYLYRIIGTQYNDYDINNDNISDGKDYLVKVISTTPTTYTSGGTTWETSTFYNNLNSSIYENLENVSSQNIIVNSLWSYGRITSTSSTAQKMWEDENQKKAFSLVGVVGGSDYKFSSFDGVFNVTKQWVALNASTREGILSENNLPYAGYYLSSRYLYSSSYTYPTNIRYSLYLKPNTVVIGGTGTSADPYIVDAKYNGVFDIVNQLELDDINGYRFNGSVVRNYVCFGTTDLTTCKSTANNRPYMYRIIGVIPTEYSSNNTGTADSYQYLLKIVRQTNLQYDSAQAHPYGQTTDWRLSSINKYINSSDFLSIFDSSWTDKIVNAKWKLATIPAPASSITKGQLYTYESTAPDSWFGKISLPYLSDTLLAGSAADTEALSAITTSAKTGYLRNIGYSLSHTSDGKVLGWVTTIKEYDVNSATASVFPTFYLTPDVKIIDGTGTAASPYILSFD